MAEDKDKKAPAAKPAAEKTPVPKPRKAAAAKPVDAGNGDSKPAAKSEGTANAKPAPAAEKPAGRLLPWEPGSGTPEQADKD